MRCMDLNKRRIWYAGYLAQREALDENGNRTGQYIIEYGKPVSIMANVSAAKGEIATRQFGEAEAYDRVIVYSDPDVAIDEYSILWVDVNPMLDRHGDLATNAQSGEIITPHDYIVKRVARSINSVSIAIDKVNIHG